MADLSPDLSPYKAIAAEGQQGIGKLDLGSLLNIARASREMQTQNAMSDALKSSIDPNTGQPDYGAALGKFMRSGAPIITPENTASFATAGANVTSAMMDQLRKGADFLAFHADDPDLDHDKAVRLLMAAGRGGIPAQTTANIISTLPAPTGDKTADRKALSKALLEWQSTLTGGQMVPLTSIPGRGGEPLPVSPTEQALIGRGLAPAPEGAITAPSGRPMTSLPKPTEKTIGIAGDMAAELLGGGQRRSSMNAMLQTLDELGHATEISAPTADIEKRLKQMWQRVFPSGEDSPAAKDVASAEGYTKIANMITSQMATHSHASDAFLNNAYGANPQLDLSKLGRSGMTHFLQGTNDAESRVASEWSDWITAHPGSEGRHISWLNGQEPGSTIDIRKFDPRVFQYARMTPQERSDFHKQMSPNQWATLNQHAQEYYKRGWVDFKAP